ncbi:hypothetical protein [Arthrobacter sp. H14-L1]|uniref:hypothetical protein n=1 Tax=Arthrobacter sp. H14-L1 TaxID=2996697 RepID=UPI00226E2679|nr:hypothetical protein [Arthrobacter sp. H14-L1]MCY0906262.1 hypothetical protein [Arthrobacter sp. H14-L1]
MTSRVRARRKRISVMDVVLRILIAAALVIDAVVHFTLAPGYQLSAPDGIGGGNLFRIEAVAALVAAIYLLIRSSRPAYGFALLVAGAGFIAVILYRYVDIPALGPIPGMYEPVWFFEKSLSAIAEAAGAILAGIGLARVRRDRTAA